jgi:hypothetical protein
MNVAIACKENNVPGNIQSRPGHLKSHKSEIIIYVETNKPYNKQQHVHNLLLAMTHYNCLQSWLGHLKRHKSEVIVCIENNELYNKQ